MRIVDMQTNERGYRIPAAMTLRKCSVVIIGSTCRICGRDFKCESDVTVHTRWRHNTALGSLMNILDQSGMILGDLGQKCNVCDIAFESVLDLKIHKRLIHKQGLRNRGKRRREMVRVKFKLNGVTTTDVNLDRRYIELPNNLGCFVDVCAQTSNSLKNERHQDNCARDIDLSFPNHVVNKSHMQYSIRPHEAANRYIVGKFASTKGDATVVVGKSLVEISSVSRKDTIPDSNSTYEGHEDSCYFASQKTAADVFIKTFTGNTDIRDKENSQRTNERERKNVYCQNEISLGNDDTKVFLACQSKPLNKPLPMAEQNSRSSESPRYSIRWSDKVVGAKETAGLANSLTDSVEIMINNEKSYGLNGDATKRLSPPLSRLNEKTKSIKVNSNVDDDVQEVLRITRGNAQNDINHESPNRMEREMLLQNAIKDTNTINDTFTLPSQLEPSVCPEKHSVTFMNFEPSNYSTFMAVTDNDYQLSANAFDKKLGIYLEDLHHYGIRLYNDLPEINNNLEEYWVYTPPVYAQDIHQDFFGTWKQSGEPPYTNELKANDNEK